MGSATPNKQGEVMSRQEEIAKFKHDILGHGKYCSTAYPIPLNEYTMPEPGEIVGRMFKDTGRVINVWWQYVLSF